VKDVAGQMAAMGQALGGMFASDEIIKGSMASFAFEAMEIAAYKALITAAEHCGDQETKRACETNLREEEEMERWLGENLPLVTERYLSLSESGATAKS
jgi:ferritin-like metal-binding protein YciE